MTPPRHSWPWSRRAPVTAKPAATSQAPTPRTVKKPSWTGPGDRAAAGDEQEHGEDGAERRAGRRRSARGAGRR